MSNNQKKVIWSGRGGNVGYKNKRHQNNNNQSHNKQFAKVKKSLSNNMYYLGSTKQTSDYQVTTAYLINRIQKTFDLPEAIRDTLRNEELVDMDKWKPELEVSTNTDDNNRATENKLFELEYKIKYTKWLNNTEIYKMNLIKPYAFLWEHCSKGMQNKIESRSKYTEIVNNPVKLLKVIKEHALNYQEH